MGHFKVFVEFLKILLLFYVFFVFFGLQTCRILSPQRGIEPLPTALEGEVLTIGPPEVPPFP